MNRVKKAPRKVPKAISAFDRGVISTLLAQNIKCAKIARQLNVTAAQVRLLKKKIETVGTTDRKKGTGRRRITSPQTDRYILTSVKRDGLVSAPHLRDDLQLQHLSLNTIRRRITETGELKSYWCTRKPFISAKNWETV